MVMKLYPKAISYPRGTPLSQAPHALSYFKYAYPEVNLRKTFVSIIEYKDNGMGSNYMIFKTADKKLMKTMKAMKAPRTAMKVMKAPKIAPMKVMKAMKVIKAKKTPKTS